MSFWHTNFEVHVMKIYWKLTQPRNCLIRILNKQQRGLLLFFRMKHLFSNPA